MKCRLFLVLVLLPTLTATASAGVFFGKKGKKPNPADRVPELLVTVKTDGDENKRARAAEELRQLDTASHPEVVPILIDVLLNDKKTAVRAEAAQSLGKLRPVSQEAGQALEQALAKDPSMRVRLQARSALLQYHWSGYRSAAKKDGPPPPFESKEPPLAEPGPKLLPTPTMPTTPVRLTPQPAPVPVPVPALTPPPNGAQPLPASGPDLNGPELG
ncbi:MAG TPA: HEAT repeat domain-containing protein [Gemmataceae bacterium]|jgi:hypothetical protein|nr:HEAT repeat domain-containing protein [Gemmataceae bacterium]